MADLTLEDRVKIILGEVGEALTAREIAIRVAEKWPDYKEGRIENTTKKNFDFYKGIISNIHTRKAQGTLGNRGVLCTGDKPLKYYLAKWDTDIEAQVENTTVSDVSVANNLDKAIVEKDLYQPLIKYFKDNNIHAMRIDEKTSQNNKGQNGNKWLHPDIVGIKDTFAKKIDDDVIKLANNTDSNQFKLYSYEVKNEITMANARECFFQTLSNSTWANYSYLVCTSFKDDDVREELKMLCESFGVGLLRISLDSNNDEILDDETEEVVPSKEKIVDIMLLNRLAKTNSDFKEYVVKVNKCYLNKEIYGF